MIKRVLTQLQRILKRIDREISGPSSLYSEQFLYGHREILLTYAKFPADSLLRGAVEHGWALESGYGMRRLSGKRNIHLSWSENRISRSGISSKHTVAIGAPFIYAAELMNSFMSSKETPVETSAKKVLFFPVHGNEHGNQDAKSQVDLFLARYPAKNSTVCLYWVEFIDPKIRDYYLGLGFKVECVGFSGQMENTGLGYSTRKLAGSLIGGRPLFIFNTISLLKQHHVIVSGRLGTICLYAAYLNKELEILHGYEDSYYYEWDYEEPIRFGDEPTEKRYREFFEKELGQNFNEIDFSSMKFRNLAKRELGLQHLKSPTELKKILSPFIVSGANSHAMKIVSRHLDI